MEKDFKLKLVKLKKSLERGDLIAISERGGISIVTIQQMFKVNSFSELKPAMKIALDATINFTLEKKRINDRILERVTERVMGL